MRNSYFTRQNLTDQAWHFGLAAGAAWLLTPAESPLLGAALGLALGLTREVTQATGSRVALSEIPAHFSNLDPWIDLAFWAFGGSSPALFLTAAISALSTL